MRYHRSTIRPAGTAIAAVLALSSTHAFAQTAESAPPVVAAQPPVVAPATQTPAAPPPTVKTLTPVAPATPDTVFAPSNPVVQQTPPVPVAAPDPAPAPKPSASTAAVKTAPPSAKVAAPNAAALTKAPAAPATVTPVEAAAPDESEAQLTPAVPVGSEITARSVEPAAPSAATDAVAQDDSGTEALLVGLGLAAALGGLGFLALRRRRPVAVRNDSATGRNYGEPAPVAVTPVADEPVRAMAEPGYREEADLAPVTAMDRAPLAATAFSARASDADDVAAHREAMIAERPSAENPFLTRKNRLRRANFMMRQADMADRPVVTEAETVREPAFAQASAAERPLQVSYNITGGNRRQGVLKPQFG